MIARMTAGGEFRERFAVYTRRLMTPDCPRPGTTEFECLSARPPVWPGAGGALPVYASAVLPSASGGAPASVAIGRSSLPATKSNRSRKRLKDKPPMAHPMGNTTIRQREVVE